MRRAAVRTVAVAALAAAVLLPAGTIAEARGKGSGDRVVLRYPSQLTEGELRLRLQRSDEPTTIVFEKGTHAFSPQLYVFQRSNLEICGATGNPRDVTIESDGGGGGASGTAAILMEQVANVEVRDLTINATAASSGQAVRMNARIGIDQSNFFSSYVDGVTFDDCTLNAEFPIVATAAVTNVTVKKCRIEVRRSDSFGIVWGDGPGLLVTRTRFTTSDGVSALSAILVQGAGAAYSEGERARKIILTRNRVTGDFLRGFDLADVVETRVRGNRFRLAGAVTRDFGGIDTGKVGVLVRRGDSSSLPEDYEVTRNKVRNAFYGAWVLNGGQGAVRRNDFRRCGALQPDAFFNEFGGAVRLTLFSDNCRIDISRNDMRNLESPQFANSDPSDENSPIEPVPAVEVVPRELSDACFDDDGGNRLSRGRELFRRTNP